MLMCFTYIYIPKLIFCNILMTVLFGLRIATEGQLWNFMCVEGKGSREACLEDSLGYEKACFKNPNWGWAGWCTPLIPAL